MYRHVFGRDRPASQTLSSFWHASTASCGVLVQAHESESSEVPVLDTWLKEMEKVLVQAHESESSEGQALHNQHQSLSTSYARSDLFTWMSLSECSNPARALVSLKSATFNPSRLMGYLA
jgi:hypothetical protein